MRATLTLWARCARLAGLTFAIWALQTAEAVGIKGTWPTRRRLIATAIEVDRSIREHLEAEGAGDG